MNSIVIKTAALAALLGSAAAFAQTPTSPTQPNDQTTPSASPQASSQWPSFSSLDANSDGKLSREEAQASPTLVGVFVEADTDKSGSLSSSEYSKAKSSGNNTNRDTSKEMEKSTTTPQY